MRVQIRSKSGLLGLAGAGLAVCLLGCGSEESKMERGVAVDQEQAVPGSAEEFGESAAERGAAEEAEEEEQEQRSFEEGE
jgi:hypothetical protein